MRCRGRRLSRVRGNSCYAIRWYDDACLRGVGSPKIAVAVLLRAFNGLCLNQSTPRKQFAPFTSCIPARTGAENRFGLIRLTLNLGGFGILGKIQRRARTTIHGLKDTIESAYHSVGSNRLCCGLMTKGEAKVSFPRTAGAMFTCTPVVRLEVAGKRLRSLTNGPGVTSSCSRI